MNPWLMERAASEDPSPEPVGMVIRVRFPFVVWLGALFHCWPIARLGLSIKRVEIR